VRPDGAARAGDGLNGNPGHEDARMATRRFKYVIVGGGLAGASAASGIRERDTQGSVLLIGREEDLPYDRPSLTKQLWFGRKKVDDIFLHDRKYYAQSGIELRLGTVIETLDPRHKLVQDGAGDSYQFEKLLLATGGLPRRLSIPGGDLHGIVYYRTLADYRRLREAATEGTTAVVIGGGFIGSEIAAGLQTNGVKVTVLFPERYLCVRVFPEPLARVIQADYARRGVEMLAEDEPAEIAHDDGKFTVRTRGGRNIQSSLVVVGIGIAPELKLAAAGGLEAGNGIMANEYLQTSEPDIYVAGDNAFFHYVAIEQRTRVEHWDNALNQGKCAGRNMAGAREPYSYMPFFFSDLFEFGYEAVGEIDARLPTFADWQKENHTGVIYYLRDGRVAGVMLCNIWEKVERARELIRGREQWTPDRLRGVIR
jgi:3-phenylpropionate/trans-cinnamate dioxygenase ferredoxin reductase subunit